MDKFVATKNDAGQSLLHFIKKVYKNCSLSLIYKTFRLKNIKVNNKKVSDFNYQVKENDFIEVFNLDRLLTNVLEEKTQVNFKVIYEDDNILVINKPINFSVHGFKDSINKQVLSYLNYVQHDSFVPSSIGRLDKETSGVLIYGKNRQSIVELNDKIGFFEKIYALKSEYNGPNQVIKINYETKQKNQIVLKKMITEIFWNDHKLFAKLITGKKHQIRLAMKSLNCPILGDVKYGGIRAERLFLHCFKIVLKNLSGSLSYLNNMAFVSKIPWEV